MRTKHSVGRYMVGRRTQIQRKIFTLPALLTIVGSPLGVSTKKKSS